jgi:hypothetical protein
MLYLFSNVEPFTAYGAIALLVCLLAFLGLIHKTRRSTFPPGPKGLPLVKNLFDTPASFDYETYEKWGRTYGDVVYIEALHKKIVVLNSMQAAKDLMDQRSAIYSDRPYMPMLHDPKL